MPYADGMGIHGAPMGGIRADKSAPAQKGVAGCPRDYRAATGAAWPRAHGRANLRPLLGFIA